MKSPWKFLAQFTSRIRAAKTQEGSIGNDADTEASESGTRQTSALSSDSTKASGRPGHDDNPPVDLTETTSSELAGSDLDTSQPVSPPVDGETIRTPAHHEVNRSGADAHALMPESQTSKESSQALRSKRPERTKTTRTDRVSQSTAVANGDQSAQSSTRGESFFEQAATLDGEIRQLRNQLAQKLLLQNIQLKKMLERFDGS
ncbi:hypothetical protein [Pararhizobium sp. A13]|uniref:hypothetical protein n=1 Tax=Pararhizobium sp. A13 TaxID=3133975 RepID=UPI0032451BFB